MTRHHSSAVLSAVVLVLMVAVPYVATAQADVAIQTATKPEDSAQRAAESWLTLTDAGEGAASWDQAAKRFQGKVTKEEWKRVLIKLRSPLGSVVSRQVKSRTYSEKVPGASDAPNVTIEFATVFEKKGPVVETMTAMREPDGVWRVSAYTITIR